MTEETETVICRCFSSQNTVHDKSIIVHDNEITKPDDSEDI